MASRTAPVASAALPSPWILGRSQDLLLFIATPILIVPALWLARQRFDAENIAFFVASFGALGHHLPGMLRAYGDRALFTRFKARFLVAPAALAAACVFLSLNDMLVLLLVTYFWGVWHGLMQTYGFLRIYDSKRRSFDRLTVRLDLAMCIAWFVAGVLLSPTRMGYVLALIFDAGGPLISPESLSALRGFWWVILAGVTLAYAVNFAAGLRHGRRQSVVKLYCLVSSIGFWWYCCREVRNLVVGVALFEIFHDVQYLSIVWLFNRRRVAEDPGIGGFARFLFRRSWSLLGLYVGLVLAYGALGYFRPGSEIWGLASNVPPAEFEKVVVGLLTASALLHFYYDGFIWKVREPSVRRTLDLKDAQTAAAPRPVGSTLHGLRWAALMIPAAVFALIEVVAGPSPKEDRTLALAAALPGNAKAQFNLGNLFIRRRDLVGAKAAFERAIDADPEFPDPRINLAVLLFNEGARDRALAHLRQGIAYLSSSHPEGCKAHLLLSEILFASGDLAEALVEARRGRSLRPADPQAQELVRRIETARSSR